MALTAIIAKIRYTTKYKCVTTVYIRFLIFCEKHSQIRNKQMFTNALFAGELFTLFFLLFTYVLWQKGGCSFSVKSYTYLHAIVLVFGV